LRPFGNWILQDTTGEEPYTSFRWYWQSSLDASRGQVSGPQLVNIIRQEPWQQAEPHFDVAILHLDLCDAAPEARGAYRSVFAYAQPDLAAIISTHHLTSIASEELRLRCLRRLVIHNFGHVIGLPDGPRHPSSERGGRCTPPCIMHEAYSQEELLEVVSRQEGEGLEFCALCKADLQGIVFRLHFSMN